jgi:SNF2 family DNA or RNA helicase
MSRLQYLISFQGEKLLVKIEEKGASRRILYWDTLQTLASQEDQEALLFFKKILTRFCKLSATLSFNKIEVPESDVLEALRLLAKTGHPFLSEWHIPAKLSWRGDDAGFFSAWLLWKEEIIPIEACEKLFLAWGVWKGKAFPIASPVPWKWVEPFLRGPILLEGTRKKRFLEEEPPIEWMNSVARPRLHLTDPTGCFANLERENPAWEKDLIEAGYMKKIVGASSYFCPSDQVRESLALLLDVGWEIYLFGKRLFRQTKIEWELQEVEGGAAVRGKAHFQEKEIPLSPALKQGRLFIEIDRESVGLLDSKRGELPEGEWVGDTLRVHRTRLSHLIPLIDSSGAVWEEALLRTLRGLKGGEGVEAAPPGPGFRGELLPHQQKGVDWLWFLYSQGFSALLADEMGLGKTVQVLAFFSRLRTNLPILIVAPSSLLYHWQAEIFRFLPEASVIVHTGEARETKIPHCQYLITSYALLRIDEEMLTQGEFEAIVLDESHAVKTFTTKTAQAACRLKGRFRIALNGTPIENRAEEIASQFQFLMPGLIQNIEREAANIKPFILRRKKDELNLPEKMEAISWVEMGDEQRRLYDSYIEGIRTGLLKKVALAGASSHRMEILEAILRLRQIAADPRLVGQEFQGAKIERLLLDVEEALQEKRKVLIYSQFTSMLALIAKELPWPFLYLDGSVAPEERSLRVSRFQEDPEIPLFLLSLKAGGVGLNLTAADYVLLFDPWWNEAVENQAIDRAHRIGQKKTVIAKRYIAPSTIEEKMLQIKADKRGAAEALLESSEAFNWKEEDLLHLLS